MNDAETKGSAAPDDGVAELPSRDITANMLVGYNMAYFRKAAGMTQEELGQRLGWSNVAVSAAERSWDGKRVRQFDADVVVDLAMALGVPISALFLPPEDDGERRRYELPADGPDGGIPMGDLLSFAMPELPPAVGGPAIEAYEKRLGDAIGAYFPHASKELAARLRERTTDEQILEALQAARSHRTEIEHVGELMASIASDNELLQDVLSEALQASPEAEALMAKVQIRENRHIPPEHRSWQAALVEIGQELFGQRGPLRFWELHDVMDEARDRGIPTTIGAAFVRRLGDGAYELVEPGDDDTRGDRS